MTRVYRQRAQNGVWVTRVEAPWHDEGKPKPKDIADNKRVVGTRRFQPIVLTNLQKRILGKLKEYNLTGLTVSDIADELNAKAGSIHHAIQTLCGGGYVIGDRRVPTDARRGQANPIQWRLRKGK